MQKKTFQQIVSLGPSCRAKHHSREIFRRLVAGRGVFDWQTTPPKTILTYFENDFRGMFERRDLVVLRKGLVGNTRYQTEHPHEFPGHVLSDDLDRLYPAARQKHDLYCKWFVEAVQNSLDTAFILATPVDYDIITAVSSHVRRLNPNKRFDIIQPPKDDACVDDDWSGDAQLWAKHLARIELRVPLRIRMNNWRRRTVRKLARQHKELE